MRHFVSSSQMVNLVSFHFTLYFYFHFILFFYFLFLKTKRVRVGSQDAENEKGESRTNNITQYGHHILASWTTHGCLG